jgi:hypothetical protein
MNIFVDSQKLKQPAEDITLPLDNIIDNSKGCYQIALTEVSFYVGYYNISEKMGNNKFQYDNGGTIRNGTVDDGLYDVDTYFTEIKRKMSALGDKPDNVNFETRNQNAKIIITVSGGYTFDIIPSNQELLGFSSPKVIEKREVSDKAVNFLKFKNLYIHLDQINVEGNYFNSQYSDVLKVIPVTTNTFGESVLHRFKVPTYLKLNNIYINKMRMTITDEKNRIINFNNQPITYQLHISIKN